MVQNHPLKWKGIFSEFGLKTYEFNWLKADNYAGCDKILQNAIKTMILSAIYRLHLDGIILRLTSALSRHKKKTNVTIEA